MNYFSKSIDTNISEYKRITTPNELKEKLSITKNLMQEIAGYRTEIASIIHGTSNKKLFIIGPCSIHDKKSALEYAQKLKQVSDNVSDSILIVMRVYFEKPRTITGWKGLISDPHLDGTHDADAGYHLAREILLAITEIGLPVATEFLDPITPQYIDDLVSWAAIGARTIESQTHRQMASGLSIPTGFKNATSGYSDVAIHAILAAQKPSSFAGIDHDGIISSITTKGNPDTHLILRGGRDGPNYSIDDITIIKKELSKKNIKTGIIVDCSHANSDKEYTKQKNVLRETIKNMGKQDIRGVMLESHLFEGKQSIPDNLKGFEKSTLKYGISITDACIGWKETEQLITEAHKTLALQRP